MSKRDIIVVGASAGGVEALRALVAALPATLSAAILMVLHVPAHVPSQLEAILGRAGSLPVANAVDGEPLVAGRIFVAPSDRHLMIESDRIRVTRGPRENRSRPAIDVLFRSAAYSAGPRVIGILLSGMLDDGTAGMWAIKDRGGVTMVQHPEDALYPSMPESAIRHVAIDHTLPITEIPAMVERLVRESIAAKADPSVSQLLEIENHIALEGNALQRGVMQIGPISPNTCPECHGVLVRIHEGPIVRFRCHTGHAFSLKTLLAEVNQAIDNTLWGAVRAIEERSLLLRQMEEISRQMHADDAEASELAKQAANAELHVQLIRDIVMDHDILGHGSDTRS